MNPMRDVGLELLQVSRVYEDVLVPKESEPPVFAIFGLVARARRLFRAAYQLADVGYDLEGFVLLRTMLEYVFTLRWLVLDLDLNYPIWLLDDVRGLLVIDDELQRQALINEDQVEHRARDSDVLTSESRLRYEERRDQLEDQIRRVWTTRRVELKTDRLPSLQERARLADLEGLYSLVYRFDSRAAAHPHALAVEQLLERRGDDVAVRTKPTQRLPHIYGVGAALLTILLQTAGEHIEQLDLGARFEELRRTVEANRPEQA